MLRLIAASVCLFWFVGVTLICSLGYWQLYRYHTKRPRAAVSESLPRNEIPHITIIRPVKGVEPCLYQCLEATFQQTYPADKLTIYFCVSSRSDPSFRILQRLVANYPSFDAHVLVEEDDELLYSEYASKMGPNPKIRNMSRAYREAKGDLIWIMDCNVWVGKGVAGRMVDTLNGYSHDRPRLPYKFVHQIPLAVDVTNDLDDYEHGAAVTQGPLSPNSGYDNSASEVAEDMSSLTTLQWIKKCGGGRLDELFLSSSHAKWYTAINTILLAPCIVGKSNMFRKSHLDSLTCDDPEGRLPGIDFFSHNICEDHLIGDLLWKRQVPAERGPSPETFGKHCMVFGDPVIQPVAHMGLAEYIARRARWLRVRKFTVLAATLVEPFTESIPFALYSPYALTTFTFFATYLAIPATWTSFAIIALASITTWCLVDWTQYLILHSMASVETDQNTPAFARRRLGANRRSFTQWLPAWLGREVLAFPIWTWAVFGGVTVDWRGQKFRVGMDARVRAVESERVSSGRSSPRRLERGVNGAAASSKARVE